MKDIFYSTVIPTLASLIVSLIFNGVVNFSKKKKQDDKLIKSGIQALLRNSLCDLYLVWYKKGYCPLEIKNNFDNLYDKYHHLGKNGVLTQMHEEFMELPVTPPEDRNNKDK